ncbi:diaminopimelate decarboxylase [Xanthocytophaga agilis]|uniref:Diaminopimelate decarboxylase n=1 Tax=Xanthocytophaga agilis TaxID=3048010 RepID=A0AAE3R5P4_9BACT|nr:diaminopimelate decarboxylase [Xanthocytophaga agilis]MDJ1504126.1 diaminopimelate decarboxylase [Xanthocytophaga agilis]
MQLSGQQYQIQGLNVLDICQQFGTPLYVYDADVIIRQINNLKSAFNTVPLRIKFACKALTNISVLKLMQTQGIGIDAVSVAEARQALLAGFKPKDITFTSNGVDFSEIQEAVELGVSINVDNLPTLELFGKIFGNTVPCCIRLKPNIRAGGNAKIQVGHEHSKFGIPLAQLPDVHTLVTKYNIVINGLHIHTGSDILDPEAFIQGANVLFTVAKEFPDLAFIDFGGGFKVGYKKGDKTTNMPDLGEKLSAAFKEFCKDYGRELEMWFEPGKYLVSECGVLFVKANQVKQTPSITFVQVNSGLNHLIRPMMYDAYHEIVNVSNPAGELKTYDVVGYICETDTLGSDRQLNEVRADDVLALLNAGAYGFTMSSQYNARFRPAEVLVYKGEARLIRERETMEDILRNQILLDF